MKKSKDDHYALIGIYLLIVGSLLCWLCSCSSKQRMEASTDIQHTEQSAARIDSLVQTVMTWQQRIYEKQTALTDSFRHLEVRDTSRTYVVNQQGDTIKEKTVIRQDRNSNHTSKESTTELFEERFARTDSMLRLSLSRQEQLEKALRELSKTTVVVKKPPWYHRLLSSYSIFMTLAVLVFMAHLWLVRKKKSPPANIK